MFVILSYDNGSVKENLVKMSFRPLGRPKIWLPALVLVALPVMLVVRSTDGGTTGITPGALVALTLLSVLLVIVIVQATRILIGVDPDVPMLAAQLAPDHDQQRLLERWMLRARRSRNIGGICGMVVWVLGTRLEGDVLLCGVGGIALGAMLAELHTVRPSRGPRTATLDVRALGAYLMDQDRNRMLAAAVAGASLTAVAIGVDGFGLAAWCGAGALAVLGLANVVQRRVASRPRPATTESLRRADDLARELAIGRGLARPATYFAIALFARGCFLISPDTAGLGGVIGVAAWIYALFLWWSNRRLGLDFLLERREPVPA
jgi:hypothetical protein